MEPEPMALDADWEVILTSELEEQAAEAETGSPGTRSASRDEGSSGVGAMGTAASAA